MGMLSNFFNRKEVWIISWYDFPFYEGTTARIKGLASVLREHDVEVTVLSPLFHREHPSREDEVPCNVEYVDLRWLRYLGNQNNPVKLLATMLFWFIAFFRLIVISRTRNIIIQYEQTFSSPPAVLTRTFFGVTTVGDDIRLYHRNMKSWVRQVNKLFELWTCHQTDVIVTSFKLDYMILKSISGEKKTLFVPNGIHTVPFVKKNMTGKKILLFVGSLSSADNLRAVHSLLRIAEELWRRRNDFEVLIVGGPLKAVNSTMKYDVIKKGIVKFLGYVPDRKLMEIYQKAHIGLLPYFEKFPHTSQRIKTLEYFANGLAVVSTPQGVDGVEGLIDGVHFINASSTSQMVEALNSLLSNVKLIGEMATAGKSFIVSAYSWETATKNYTDLIRSLTVDSAR